MIKKADIIQAIQIIHDVCNGCYSCDDCPLHGEYNCITDLIELPENWDIKSIFEQIKNHEGYGIE